MEFKLLKSLDADDIFISYSREDASAYLRGLDAALSARGFSCFTDRRGTDANRLPPKTLFRKIRQCKTLVLLATPNALKKPENISPEVTEFAEANGTARIICISFDRDEQFSDWTKTPWYGYVEGKAREREDPNTLKTGEPSAAVVETVVTASDYMRSKDRLRKYRNRAFAGFLALLVSGLAATAFALYGFKQAKNATDSAVAARAAAATDIARSAESVKQAKRQADIEIKTAQDEAAAKISEANNLAKSADDKRVAAENQKKQAEGLRDQARAEAGRQNTIGEARRLANSSQAWLRQRPEEVQLSLRLAVDAMAKSESVNMHVLEADSALRDSLALFPRFRADRRYATTSEIILSPDGEHFGKLDSENKLTIYTIDGMKAGQPLPCDCSKVALSSGPAFAAALLNDGKLKILDLKNRSLSRTITLPVDGVEKIALSPGGRYVAMFVNQGDEIRSSILFLLDARTGKTRRFFAADDDVTNSAGERSRRSILINDLTFGSDGSLAVGGRYPIESSNGKIAGLVVIWPELVQTVEGSEPATIDANFSQPQFIDQNGEVNAIAALGPRYFATDKGIWKLTAGTTQFAPIARLPYAKNDAAVFDPESPATNQSVEITSLAFARDGSSLVAVRNLPSPSDAVTSEQKVGLEVWEAIGNQDLMHVAHEAQMAGIGFRPDGGMIASMTTEFYAKPTWRVFRTMDGQEEKAAGEFGPDVQDTVLYINPGQGLFVTKRDGAVMVWNAWVKKKTVVATPSLKEVEAATLSAGGQFLALAGPPAGSGEVVVVYHMEDGSYKEWKKPPQNGSPHSMYLSADGQFLAVQYENELTHVFNVVTERDVSPDSLINLTNVKTIAISPDGRLLVAAVRDGQVRVVALSTGKISQLLSDALPESLAFSRDGRYLAAGCEGVVYVFDASNQSNITEVARLPHVGIVNALAFSEDDRYLATASSDKHSHRVAEEESYPLRVWLLQPGDLIAEAKNRLDSLPKYAH